MYESMMEMCSFTFRDILMTWYKMLLIVWLGFIQMSIIMVVTRFSTNFKLL